MDEVARRLRLHPRTVYRLLQSGRLTGVRVGRRWRVPADALGNSGGMAQAARHERSLFGAARPFFRRIPPADADWDDLIAEAVAEDYRMMEED